MQRLVDNAFALLKLTFFLVANRHLWPNGANHDGLFHHNSCKVFANSGVENFSDWSKVYA
jgi:hypothetical protein